MNTEHLKIDIVIPTYRPDGNVVKLIKRLLKQNCLINEIHIVDTETGIFPPEIYQLSEKVKVTKISALEFDHGGTRAAAADESEADFIVFMTQDAMPLDDKLLDNLLCPFENENVAASYARQIADKSCGEIERYTRMFNYPKESKIKDYNDIEKIGVKAFFCSNVCAAYRKSVYDELGGFVRRTIFNEDSIMAANLLKNGYSIAYAAEARVLHCHKYTCIQQFKRNFDMAVSQADHPEIFREVKSESEGIRLVKDTARHLFGIRKPWLIISLVMQSGSKYLGYLLGKNYRKIPKRLILKLTSNKNYWNKK